MKLLLKLLFVAVLGVLLALVAIRDTGYVLISREPWAIELSLTLFVLLLLASFFLLYWLVRFIHNSWTLSQRVQDWQSRRRIARARRSLNRGLLELAQRHWGKAEKLLIQHVDDSESPLLNYLAAASAAQEQGEDGQRDQYLSRAHESMPGADVAVAITQADLQLRHGQLEQCLATLVHLRRIAPRHPYVLKLLMRLYTELKDWASLREIFPDLRRYKAADADALDTLEATAYAELLTAAGRDTELQQLWRDVPKRLRSDASLLKPYARGLLEFKDDDEAVSVLHAALNRNWDTGLLASFAAAQGSDAERQLALAEKWSAQHGNDPALLATLGKLAVRCELWGKARAWYEASIGQSPQPRTYRDLGELLERLDEPERAAECYRKGLLLIDNE